MDKGNEVNDLSTNNSDNKSIDVSQEVSGGNISTEGDREEKG